MACDDTNDGILFEVSMPDIHKLVGSVENPTVLLQLMVVSCGDCGIQAKEYNRLRCQRAASGHQNAGRSRHRQPQTVLPGPESWDEQGMREPWDTVGYILQRFFDAGIMRRLARWMSLRGVQPESVTCYIDMFSTSATCSNHLVLQLRRGANRTNIAIVVSMTERQARTRNTSQFKDGAVPTAAPGSRRRIAVLQGSFHRDRKPRTPVRALRMGSFH